MRKFNSIELFAGCGGTALGLENAGFENILAVDNDKNACKTLRKNRPEWNIVCDDIKNIDFKPYNGLVDLLSGGVPCQSWSLAGIGLGFDDPRGQVFFDFLNATKTIEPKFILFENVKGMLLHNSGETFQFIRSKFHELGYKTYYKLINAYNLGVPQKRERLIMIGVRDDLNTKYLFPCQLGTTKTDLRMALDGVPESNRPSYSESKRCVLDLVPPGGCWRDLPINVQKEYMGSSYNQTGGRTGIARRLSWDKPSPTLTCSPSQKQTERCHPDETRPLTVREYARIQTFPDDWEFCGSISSQYKQIGNAVPVLMAEKIGEMIYSNLLYNFVCNG